VYMYFNAEGRVIYVGKAKNLKRRVSSYFNREHESVRTRLLVRAIADMNYIVVPTEEDALNLENSLIKEHQPRYNVLLKDDKSYPWICVTNEMYPRVFLTYNKVKNGGRFYGPYTNTAVARVTLDLINRLYPVRSCRSAITPEFIATNRGRLCLEYHIKNCLGCCTGLISADEYQQYIARIKQILNGDTQELMDYLVGEMQALAAELKFEQAQALKEKYQLVEKYRAKSVIVSQTVSDIDVFGIEDDDRDVYINYMHVRKGVVVRSLTLEYKRRLEESQAEMLAYAMTEVSQQLGIKYRDVIVPVEPEIQLPDVIFYIPQRGDKKQLLDVSVRNARQKKIDSLKQMEKKDPEQRVMRTLERLKTDLRMSELPRHIECFDNSNTQGTDPVSACVVFKNARPSKRDYRHFIVKTVEGPNDFATMQEVITRRYTRMLDEEQELPQLIIVDGGKGQLSAAVEVLDRLGLRGKIAIIGIAERLEEIYFPGDSVPLYINKNSESLRVIQHLRDEAHRFGITHHRKRRAKSQTRSELDAIKGIGDKTKTALLTHFKSVKRIREATLDQIAAIIGPAKAQLVHQALTAKK
ncbi:MAG: excinuclease ABC subunit UvrC, partial [Muribaculaceae bacterium]|nr:excinuclease ABC subunit UvrC [Muribaculaceae bacterium]